MKKSVIALSLVFCAATIAGAADGAAIYKKCSGCHGADGAKVPLGIASGVVKGQSAADLETKLKGYADGSYGGAKKGLMKGQVSKLSDEDIKAVSEYMAGF